MIYDTAGNLIIFHDMCTHCQLTTGGQHEPKCPCYQLSLNQIKPDIRFNLTMQGLEDLRQRKFSYYILDGKQRGR